MKIQSVVVLGNDVAGLLAALTLKRRLTSLAVRVIRKPSVAPSIESEATTAALAALLFVYLGLKPAQFYKEVGPTWRLGTRFLWGPRPEFFYACAREYEQSPPEFSRSIGYYCTNGSPVIGASSALMHHGKAFPRRPDGMPLLARQHGFHLELPKLIGYLEDRCRECGVILSEGTVQEIGKSAGGIASLQLKGGERVSADLFIDASGSRSELLEQTLAEPFTSYEQALPCDRIAVAKWARTAEPIAPYTTIETMEAGWCWQIEHEHTINRGYVYASQFITDSKAEAELLRKNPKSAGPLEVRRFRSGRHSRLWVENVIAIGDSAGFIEPLQPIRLHAACTQARLLTDSLADSLLEPTPSLRDLYNHAVGQEWDELRDFLLVHYAFNSRLDTPFWRERREKTDLGGAAKIVRFYQENGPSLLGSSLLIRHDSPFGLDGYLALLIGQQVPYEKNYRPSAAEQHAWRKKVTQFESQAQRALTVSESLEALRRAEWTGF